MPYANGVRHIVHRTMLGKEARVVLRVDSSLFCDTRGFSLDSEASPRGHWLDMGRCFGATEWMELRGRRKVLQARAWLALPLQA